MQPNPIGATGDDALRRNAALAAICGAYDGALGAGVALVDAEDTVAAHLRATWPLVVPATWWQARDTLSQASHATSVPMETGAGFRRVRDHDDRGHLAFRFPGLTDAHWCARRPVGSPSVVVVPVPPSLSYADPERGAFYEACVRASVARHVDDFGPVR